MLHPMIANGTVQVGPDPAAFWAAQFELRSIVERRLLEESRTSWCEICAQPFDHFDLLAEDENGLVHADCLTPAVWGN